MTRVGGICSIEMVYLMTGTLEVCPGSREQFCQQCSIGVSSTQTERAKESSDVTSQSLWMRFKLNDTR